MSTGLDAVYEELKRLQKEGLDRVYIEDNTAALLPPPIEKAPIKQEKASPPADGADLKAALETPEAPTQKTPAKPAPAPKKAAPPVKPLPDSPPTLELPKAPSAEQMQWLQEQVENSPVSLDHIKTGEQFVFGSGAIDADIFFCGEAPGEHEAITGQPFAGDAGALLDKILKAMGLDRKSVYMTNIMKWRPEHNKPYGNRPPTPEEMEFCLPYLRAQLEIVQPQVIIGLGNATILGLLKSDTKMTEIRGTWQTFDELPLIFTFQPSYLLFNDTMKTKRMAWEDMLKVMGKTGMPISEKQQGFFLPK